MWALMMMLMMEEASGVMEGRWMSSRRWVMMRQSVRSSGRPDRGCTCLSGLRVYAAHCEAT
jgi:hypothetical protein